MAKIRDDEPLLPSVWNRLIDDESLDQGGHLKSSHQLLREIKQNVRRDLEKLLNTRWRCQNPPPEFEQLKTSLVNYGLPDFSGMNLNMPDQREQLRSTVEQIIRRYEPRFKSVRVTLVDPKNAFDRTVHFRIDAMLVAEPAPEPVTFDSVMQPSNTTFEIRNPTR